ncbi:MAG: Na+/H+ antiporter NhaC family protein [Bacteroidota bacterium]|nr:Na+/H+ antiporter NhaC family protein [Bacteroidota bacterium]
MSIENKKLISLFDSLIPLVALVTLLYINVSIYGDSSLNGSNQFILIIGSSIAFFFGIKNKVKAETIFNTISNNFKSISTPIIILLLVGGLSGSWMISGIIPSMIYYGLKLINVSFFLPTCVIISAIVAISTGSSWSTTATIGIGLIGIGKVLGFDLGLVAGAIISGAYFGDKMSPLSDTTNLAAAVTESNLFEHIKYMTITTFPTIIITIIFFTSYNIFNMPSESIKNLNYVESIKDYFFISPILFFVPIIVIVLIIKKISPVISLFIGIITAAFLILVFQNNLISSFTSENGLSTYEFIINSIVSETKVETGNSSLDDLFYTGGMKGMLNTIWLVICAMIFGGVMEAIGALKRISYFLLEKTKSIFGLFSSTVISCLTVNISASDQYLAIVVPGKMFSKAYKDRNLSTLNLSRTIEDSGTVTSVLIPWNTCGAYQASVLNVNVLDYFIFAIFNWLSPITTLIIALVKYKIKKI